MYGVCTRRNGHQERVYLRWNLNYADVAISIIKIKVLF